MTNKELRKLAIEASQRAYSPYSNYKVGAAVLTSSGQVYTGANIENSSYGASVCGERVAIWNAISHGEKNINKIYLYTDDGWPPCGMCRQVMSEFVTDDFELIISDKQGNEKTYKFEEILPLAFTPSHMGK